MFTFTWGMGICFEVGKRTVCIIYFFVHSIFFNVIYDGFIWSKGMGFFFLVNFLSYNFKMSCYHVCIVVQCVIFAYILYILSFTLQIFLIFYSFVFIGLFWANGQKHDSLSYNIFTTIFCRQLHIKSMQ